MPAAANSHGRNAVYENFGVYGDNMYEYDEYVINISNVYPFFVYYGCACVRVCVCVLGVCLCVDETKNKLKRSYYFLLAFAKQKKM